MRNKHVEDEMQKVENNTLPNTCDLSARFLMNIRVCVRMTLRYQRAAQATGR